MEISINIEDLVFKEIRDNILSVCNMFIEETNALRRSYQILVESDISEPTKKEANLVALTKLNIPVQKRFDALLLTDDPPEYMISICEEFLGMIKSLQKAHIEATENDIDEETKKDSVIAMLDYYIETIEKYYVEVTEEIQQNI